MEERIFTARKWLSLLKPHLSRIEARVVQWLAQGRLRPPKPLIPGAATDSLPLRSEEDAVWAAKAANGAAELNVGAAKAALAAAATALQEQLEAGAPPSSSKKVLLPATRLDCI